MLAGRQFALLGCRKYVLHQTHLMSCSLQVFQYCLTEYLREAYACRLGLVLPKKPPVLLDSLHHTCTFRSCGFWQMTAHTASARAPVVYTPSGQRPCGGGTHLHAMHVVYVDSQIWPSRCKQRCFADRVLSVLGADCFVRSRTSLITKLKTNKR